MLRIAHVSDLHVLSPVGIEWRRIIFNRRVTGLANLLLRRARVFRPEHLTAVLGAAAKNADQLVITGDLTNLSLETEFAQARRIVDDLAKKVEVSVIPGNHDLYLPDTAHKRRFSHYFGPFMRSDLPDLRAEAPAGLFPSVRLAGPAALIGLSSAVPRPPFVSAGYLGKAQIAALRAVLARPEVASRTPVILVHHDPLDSRYRIEQMRRGLVDARELRSAISQLARGLVLFGHLHIRRYSRFQTDAGWIDVVCASGASLEHEDERIRAGFNLYTLQEDRAIKSIEAWVLDPATDDFRRYDLGAEGRSA
jgi:3',5'-cyclic AMP phosphodiesterase CpdA